MLLRPPPAVATRPAFARAAPSRARLTARSAAAAAGGSGSAEYDPYKVLGVHPLAGADEFSRARARQVRDATARGDEATAAAAEAAYDAVMMRQLALRMKGQGPLGGVAVSNSVAFADRSVRSGGRAATALTRRPQALLPAWAPKRAALEGKELGMNAVLALACLSWSLMHPSPGLQPMTVAMTLFFFRMNSKARAVEGGPSGGAHGCADAVAVPLAL